jgi:hypothetical protein
MDGGASTTEKSLKLLHEKNGNVITAMAREKGLVAHDYLPFFILIKKIC